MKKRNYDREARVELLRRYGPDCACCGESELAFLQIDHKFGHGAAHRRLMKPNDPRGSNPRTSARVLLCDLRERGFPKVLDLGNGIYDELQVLCANCNTAKAYHGYCPHNPEETTTAALQEFWTENGGQLFLGLDLP
jgi:hypothetical protein